MGLINLIEIDRSALAGTLKRRVPCARQAGYAVWLGFSLSLYTYYSPSFSAIPFLPCVTLILLRRTVTRPAMTLRPFLLVVAFVATLLGGALAAVPRYGEPEAFISSSPSIHNVHAVNDILVRRHVRAPAPAGTESGFAAASISSLHMEPLSVTAGLKFRDAEELAAAESLHFTAPAPRANADGELDPQEIEDAYLLSAPGTGSPFGDELELSFESQGRFHAYNLTLLPSVFTPDATISVDGKRVFAHPPPTSYRATFTDASGAPGVATLTLDPTTGALVDALVLADDDGVHIQPARRLLATPSLAPAFTPASRSVLRTAASAGSRSPFVATALSELPLRARDAAGNDVPYLGCGGVASDANSGEDVLLPVEPVTSPSLFAHASAHATTQSADSDVDADSGVSAARRPLLTKWTSCFAGGARTFRMAIGVAYGVTASTGSVAATTAYMASMMAMTNAVYSAQLDVTLALSRLLVCTTSTCTDGGNPVDWNRDYNNDKTNCQTDPAALLTLVLNWRTSNTTATVDNRKTGAVHVITNCFPPAGTVGMARLGTAAMISGAGGWSQFHATTWLTFAHEVGHTFNLPHPFATSSEQGVYGGIMDYNNGGRLNSNAAVDPGQIGFNVEKEKTIFCNNVNTSLYSTSSSYVSPRTLAWVTNTAADAVCGNGVVEVGEECDSGVSGGNACCTAACKFTAGSRCSETAGECCVNCQPKPTTATCRAAFGPLGYCGPAGRCATSECHAYGNLLHCGIKSSDQCSETCALNTAPNPTTCPSFSVAFNITHGSYCTVSGTTTPGRCTSPNPGLSSRTTTCQPLTYTATDVGTSWSTCTCASGTTVGTRTRELKCWENGDLLVAQSLCSASSESCTCASTESYSWSATAWSTCAATTSCDINGGTQTRNVTCKTASGTTTDEANCVASSKPVASQACTATCTYSYKCAMSSSGTYGTCGDEDNWATCTSTCGTGTQARVVQCRDQLDANAASSKCSGTVPASSRACSATSGCKWWCTATGATSRLACTSSTSWATCSNDCGSGSQTRSVVCAATSSSTVQDNALCVTAAGASPVTSQTCTSTSGCVTQWYCTPKGAAASAAAPCNTTDNWAACTGNCGAGTRDRTVACRNQAGTAATTCGTSPATSEDCVDTAGCGGQPLWRCGASTATRVDCDDNSWGDCVGSCGAATGVRTRTVVCVNPTTNAAVSDSACDGLHKPATSVTGCTASPTSTGCTADWRCWSPTAPALVTCSDTGSEWTACSSKCSSTGRRGRNVGCFVLPGGNAAPIAVNNSVCASAGAGTQPAASSSCTDRSACAWVVKQSWSGCPACSVNPTTSPGTMTRVVSCVDSSASLINSALLSDCEASGTVAGTKPATSAACTDTPQCPTDPTAAEPTYGWERSAISACTGACSWGVLTSTVTCCRYTTDTPTCTAVSDGFCPATTRPSTETSCLLGSVSCQNSGTCSVGFTGTPSRLWGTCTCYPGTRGDQCAEVATLNVTSVTVSGASSVGTTATRGSKLTVNFSYSGSSWASSLNTHFLIEARGSGDDVRPMMTVPVTATSAVFEVPTSWAAFSFTVRVSVSASLYADSASTFSLGSICDSEGGSYCGLNGVCSRTSAPSDACTCKEGYSGARCENGPCVTYGCNTLDTSSCAPRTFPGVDSATTGCVCKAGYHGTTCGTPTTCDLDAAATAAAKSTASSSVGVCLNNGFALAKTGGLFGCGTCVCTGDWTGSSCQTCDRRCSTSGSSGTSGRPSSDCSACECSREFVGDQCECRGVALVLTFAANNLPLRVTILDSDATKAFFARAALELTRAARGLLPGGGSATGVPASAGKVTFRSAELYTSSSKIDYVIARFHLNGYCATPDAATGRFVIAATNDPEGADQSMVSAYTAVTALAAKYSTLVAATSSVLSLSEVSLGLGVSDSTCTSTSSITCPASTSTGVPSDYNTDTGGSGGSGTPGWVIAVVVICVILGVLLIACLLSCCCCQQFQGTRRYWCRACMRSSSGSSGAPVEAPAAVVMVPVAPASTAAPPVAPVPPQQPPQFYGQQQSGYGQPQPGYGQPQPGFGQPQSGYGQPAGYPPATPPQYGYAPAAPMAPQPPRSPQQQTYYAVSSDNPMQHSGSGYGQQAPMAPPPPKPPAYGQYGGGAPPAHPPAYSAAPMPPRPPQPPQPPMPYAQAPPMPYAQAPPQPPTPYGQGPPSAPVPPPMPPRRY